MNILKVLGTLLRDMDCLFSKHTFGKKAIAKISFWQIFLYGWIDKLLQKIPWKIFPLKKENTSNKINSIQTNKKNNLNTNNLMTSIFFYHQKIFLIFFSAPMKFWGKHIFLKQCNPIEDLSPREDYFPSLAILTSLNTKNWWKEVVNAKNLDFFFEKNRFSF